MHSRTLTCASGEMQYKVHIREFPGNLVIRTQHFHWHGPGSTPGQGTKIPQITQHSQERGQGWRMVCSEMFLPKNYLTQTYQASKIVQIPIYRKYKVRRNKLSSHQKELTYSQCTHNISCSSRQQANCSQDQCHEKVGRLLCIKKNN